MMKLLSLLHKQTNYESLCWYDSRSLPGVRFAVRKASLLQRIELTSRIKELALNHEFLKAGDIPEQLDATMADLLVRRLYLEWGLDKISGLRIDGDPATLGSLVERGPETLVEEILAAIKAELDLSEDERKN
jgi:hypothetical protein